MGEYRRTLILLLLLISLIVSVPETEVSTAQSNTIIVPDDYPTVEAAIHNANDGDTVFVKKGIHEGPINQTLVINKTISLIGEDLETTILNLHPLFGTAWLFTLKIGVYSISIQIEANDVTLSGFTIRSPGTGIAANGDPDGCISVTGDRVKIGNNNITTTILSNGNSIQIANNSISSIQGAVSVKGMNSTIAHNTITNGIAINGYYTRIIGNNVTNRQTHPIIHTKTDFNLIYGNTITAGTSSYCIEIGRDAQSNEFIENVMIGSLGIHVDGGNRNTFYANNITTSGIGIYMPQGHNNTFHANNIANSQTGARLGIDMTDIAREFGPSAANNLLYHNNFINYTKGSVDWNWLGTNYWDNGTEGNYWSEFEEFDWNDDGIGDLPYYLLYGSCKDSHPLMEPFNISSLEIELPKWECPILNEPLEIHISLPQNTTYTASTVFLVFVVTEETSWMGYSLDGQDNVTITRSELTLSGLGDGSHNLVVYANDTVGIVETSKTVSFTIDSILPVVLVLSPMNTTYFVSDIPLKFTVNKEVKEIKYWLDGLENVTISGNTILTGLSNGSHSLTVFVKDWMQNTGKSETIIFTINQEPEPEPTSTPWTTIALAIVAALIAASVLIYHIIIRKQKK